MPSNNRIIICAAGGGKTTRIVADALGDKSRKTALLTYTRNNEKEIERKFYESGPALPSHVEVMTWLTFLLQEMARPYQRAVYDRRIEGYFWVEGRSVKFAPATTAEHYFADGDLIYSDKISKFICECDRATNGAVLQRLAQRFAHVFVDEVQDMAGYDLDVLELILKAGIKVTLVGDHRQAILKTNNSNRHSGFAGIKIIKKFREWDKAGLATLCYEQHTYRCHQDIADLGDSFFPKEPNTKSLNDQITGHDGLFVIPKALVAHYSDKFSPQVLRYSSKTDCHGLPAMNFGEAKGLTFNRVLIFPHGLGQKWLKTGDMKHVEKSAARMYVGVTRARHSVAFVLDGASAIPKAQIYSPER